MGKNTAYCNYSKLLQHLLVLALLHNARPYDHYNGLQVVDDNWKLITAL